MFKRALAIPIAVLTLTWGSTTGKSAVSADVAKPLLESLESDDICLMPPTLEQRAEYMAALAAYQNRQGAAAAPQGRAAGRLPGWPGKNTIGGNIPPTAAVMDPWPTFDGIAVDGENGIVAMSDENRHGLLIYNTSSGSASPKVTSPRGWVLGPSVKLGFVAGVTVNPKKREVIVTNNDGGGVEVFSYDANGDTQAGPLADGAAPVMGPLARQRQQRARGDEPAVPGHLDLFRRRLRRGAAAADDPRHGDAARGSARRVPAQRAATRCSRRTTATGPRCAPTPATSRRSRASTSRAASSPRPSASTRRRTSGDVPPIRTLQGNQHAAGVADGHHRRQAAERAARRQLREQLDPVLPGDGERRRRAGALHRRPAHRHRRPGRRRRRHEEQRDLGGELRRSHRRRVRPRRRPAT